MHLRGKTLVSMTRLLRCLLCFLMVIRLGHGNAFSSPGPLGSYQDVSISSLCLFYAAKIEKKYNIPSKLLQAISLAESGKYIAKKYMPWPWTIHARGKGYFFRNKKEAIQAVKSCAYLVCKTLMWGACRST